MLERLFRRKTSIPRADFERTVLPHLDALYTCASHLLRHDPEAEDLVQETLLRAYRFFHAYDSNLSVKAWLFKILHNVFSDTYRRGANQRRIEGALEAAAGEGATLSTDTVDAARDPEAHLLRDLLSDDVRRALDSLPPDFREVIVLSDLEDLSYKEIAEILDWPTGTIMSRLFRARRELQASLRGYARSEGVLRGLPHETPAAFGEPISTLPQRRQLP